MHPWKILVNLPDSFYRCCRVEAILFDPGGDGQGQGVVEDFMGRNAIFQGIAIGPLGDGKFTLGRTGHTFFINGADDNGGSVGTGQFKYLEKAFIAIFVVG